VVKLGTITPEGDASVHCYTCDDEVQDNFLADHLNNFGIEVGKQTKTEKTIAELVKYFDFSFQDYRCEFEPLTIKDSGRRQASETVVWWRVHWVR
jgi:uncharacterized UBP type Zn finger protein